MLQQELEEIFGILCALLRASLVKVVEHLEGMGMQRTVKTIAKGNRGLGKKRRTETEMDGNNYARTERKAAGRNPKAMGLKTRKQLLIK